MDERAATRDTTQDTAEHTVAEFIERMGVIAQADGLPRIAGRLMGFLVIHGGPVSFGELSERLQISRASVSNNTRLLEGLGVIERTSVPGDRQDYFRLAEAPYHRLLQGVVERMGRASAAAERTARELPEERGGARRRLRELSDFYASAEENTRKLLASMAQQRR